MLTQNNSMDHSEMQTKDTTDNKEISFKPTEMEDKTLLNQNNETLYSCCFCDKTYNKKNSLLAHKYQKHSNQKSSKLKEQRVTKLKQYGTVKEILDTEFSVLVNDISYHTDIIFIPFEKIKLLSTIYSGSKIKIVDENVMLAEFLNCTRCHKTLILKEDCCCKPEKSIETFGVLIKKKITPLPESWGMKIVVKCGERLIHSVIPYDSAIYQVLSDIEIGHFIVFKFILLSSDNKNDLVRIFFVRNFL